MAAFQYLDVGSKEANGISIVKIPVDVRNSDSVTIKNIAGDTLSYGMQVGHVADGTITATNSVTRTVPTVVWSAGRTSISITGGSSN